MLSNYDKAVVLLNVSSPRPVLRLGRVSVFQKDGLDFVSLYYKIRNW